MRHRLGRERRECERQEREGDSLAEHDFRLLIFDFGFGVMCVKWACVKKVEAKGTSTLKVNEGLGIRKEGALRA